MWTIFAVLSFGALSICVLALHASSAQADHTGGGMQAMSIDMNEEAAPANTSSVLGTREVCARINENNVIDADEDVADGVVIDVTAQGIPAYHDSGTPGNPTDDTGGMEAFQFVLVYSSANLTVDSYVATNPGINMLARNAGSAVIVVTDPVPDDNADDQWLHGGLDGGAGVREDGSGTLTRLTLVSEATALSGSYSLALDSSNSAHIDASGTAYAPSTINNAFVSVNVSCADPDGDGVTGGDDACPTIPGPPSNNGCPPPGPPAVGGTAGLIAPPASNSTGKLPIIATLTATALIACLAGGAFVRLVARRARR